MWAMTRLPRQTCTLGQEAWPHRLLCQLLVLVLGNPSNITPSSRFLLSTDRPCLSSLVGAQGGPTRLRGILCLLTRLQDTLGGFLGFLLLEIFGFYKRKPKILRDPFCCPSFCLFLTRNNEHLEEVLPTGMGREEKKNVNIDFEILSQGSTYVIFQINN